MVGLVEVSRDQATAWLVAVECAGSDGGVPELGEAIGSMARTRREWCWLLWPIGYQNGSSSLVRNMDGLIVGKGVRWHVPYVRYAKSPNLSRYLFAADLIQPLEFSSNSSTCGA